MEIMLVYITISHHQHHHCSRVAKPDQFSGPAALPRISLYRLDNNFQVEKTLVEPGDTKIGWTAQFIDLEISFFWEDWLVGDLKVSNCVP